MSLWTRIPVALLGGALAASALQSACFAPMDAGALPDVGAGDAGPDAATPDAGTVDASDAADASEDSPDDRADGMSYGDGYGAPDAGAPDGSADGSPGPSCVSSTATDPPAPGCPAGDHTWTCWPPTPATGGVPDSHYDVLTLCGDVVVVDRNTHLMWGQQGEPGTYSWVAANAACTASRRAGFSDWRLPSSNELMSLVDYANPKLILDPDVFQGNYAAMWSSTQFVQKAGNAWQLYASGGVYPQVVSNAANVRCVR
jgi:hypothetical protein